MPKTLSILERAYHGTIEEQDDTILWINLAMKGAGGDLAVLLRSNAVNYAVKSQDHSGLVIGDLPLTHPPEVPQDIKRLMDKGVPVYALQEDLEQRGIEPVDLVDGVHILAKASLPEFLNGYDRLWHW